MGLLITETILVANAEKVEYSKLFAKVAIIKRAAMTYLKKKEL